MFDVFAFLKKDKPVEYSSLSHEEPSIQPPSIRLSTDKLAYRPGDTLQATIEVSRDDKNFYSSTSNAVDEPILLENLIVEVKGIEKLDPQWLLTVDAARGSKHRRGERIILESSPTAIVSGVHLEQGAKRTYLVRTVLPKVLPPSYKGTAVRYLYYIVINVQWSVVSVENGHGGYVSPKTAFVPLEVRTFFNIWTIQTNNGLTGDDPQAKDYAGIVPQLAIQVEIYWKEKNDENDWVRAADVLSEIDDDAISQTTESMLLTPSTRNLEMLSQRFIQHESPLTMNPQGEASKSLQKTKESRFSSLRQSPLSALSNSINYERGEDSLSRMPEKRSSRRANGSVEIWPNNNELLRENDVREDFDSRNHDHEVEPTLTRSPSGAFTRGRSYNIKFDDQVLARFSPRNPDSTYYFGDVVGGVLRFFHDEGSRRCLEVSAVLETRESLNPAFIHPSRRNSPIITKVQADYYEVVADMLQTHFIFSIPLDGPPTFTTPHVSLQWVLRIEFVTTTRDVDLSQHKHPLLIEERERGEWTIPILVHAPLPRTQKSNVTRERPSSLRKDVGVPYLLLPSVRGKHVAKDTTSSTSPASIK